MEWLWLFAGALIGSLPDPVVITVIALGVVLGAWRIKWPWVAAAVVLVFAVRAGISVSNRQALGMALGPWPFLSGIAGGTLLAAGYGVGRLIPRSRTPRDPQ